MLSKTPALTNLILVGCVKSKRIHISAAQDLYNSRLWRCRRAYAERSGNPWYILSAKHGLLTPETMIAPYELSLADLSAAERRAWSQRLLDDLTGKVSPLRGISIEIHAGKHYIEYGLENGLREAGAIIRRPLAHVVGIGPQCTWYVE